MFFPVDFDAPTAPVSPRVRYSDFCREAGPRASAQDFLGWYRKTHPSEYTRFF
jgi:hypothetical protein